MALIERVLEGLEERRNTILTGNINSIPSPFVRFRKDYIGIEQSQLVILTANTKVGKTQIASYLYIYNPIMYAYYHPDQLNVNILYFPLEETAERVTQRFMSFLLFTLSQGRIIVSPTDLRSTDSEKPISQEVLDVLHSEKYQSILKFYEEHVYFIEDKNASGEIYNTCLSFMKTRGTVTTKKAKYGDVEYDQFDRYDLKDPKEYNIMFVDHVGLLSQKSGQTLKQSIDDLSKHCAKFLRNRYKMTCVLIQQQGTSIEGLEAQKLGKMTPSIVGLSDSSYTAKDADIMLGLFSPFKFELPSYLGYKITEFKDRIRFLSVIINRNGMQGGVCPLLFIGESCIFKELALPGTPELDSIYNYIKTLD